MAMARKGRRRWSQADLNVLIDGWCEDHVETIAAKLDRSPDAVALKARALRLGGARTRYTSMCAAARRTGWDARTICRAAARIGVTLWRAPRTCPGPRGSFGRWYGITEEQLGQIVEYLKERSRDRDRVASSRIGEWGGRKPTACLRCGRSDVRHYARGLCERCYGHALAEGVLDRYPSVRRPRQEAA